MGDAQTFAAFEGVVGYVPEDTTGVTPVAGGAPYFDDSGTFRFFPFGAVTISAEPDFNTNQILKRGIGNRTHVCNKHGRFDSAFSVEFYPDDFSFVPFALGSASDLTDHLPALSIERAFKRTVANPLEFRELISGAKVNTWTIEANIDDAVKFSAEFIAEFIQSGTSKSYVGEQTVTVGADPVQPDDDECDLFMFYEGDIYITRSVVDEDVSAQFTGAEVICTVANAPINWLLTETDPLDAQPADVVVTVDGTPVTVTGISGTTITLAAPPGGATTVLVDYHDRFQLINVSAYTIELDNALRANTGLIDGTPKPYEVVKTANDISGNLVTNFSDLTMYNQHRADDYLHVMIEIGQTKVFIMGFSKWEPNTSPPMSEDDLVEEPLDYKSQTMRVLDVPAGW